MKLDELLNEQSSKPVTQRARPVIAQTPKTPSRKDVPPTAPVSRKPLTSRAEILEAIQLLANDARITSIKGGKSKKRGVK